MIKHLYIFCTVAITAILSVSTILPATGPRLSFAQRSQVSTHSVAQQLLTIMDSKQTNLVLAADVSTKAALLELADTVGPEICMLKTHIDIIQDFDQDLIQQLTALAQKHNFLLWEDRKFADIGSVAAAQYTGGIFRIADWADVITVHSIAGAESLKALANASSKKLACLLIAEMSSKGTLAHGDYTQATTRIAHEYPEHVLGFICQKKLSDNPSFIHCTPGVQLSQGSDGLGQQYLTPEVVITHHGNDIIIVGRGILQAKDQRAAAQMYRKSGWQAYQNSLAKQRLACALHSIGAIKFGSFKLKSGVTSPIYIDMRVTISHPTVLAELANALKETVKSINPELLCGVPYGALPLATAVSLTCDIPMIMLRKEAKSYGTNKLIEGCYAADQQCLLIEDVVTTGSSILESISQLTAQNLNVTHALTLVDRQQGGRENLMQRGCQLHALFTITEILDALLAAGAISQEQYTQCKPLS